MGIQVSLISPTMSEAVAAANVTETPDKAAPGVFRAEIEKISAALQNSENAPESGEKPLKPGATDPESMLGLLLSAALSCPQPANDAESALAKPSTQGSGQTVTATPSAVVVNASVSANTAPAETKPVPEVMPKQVEGIPANPGMGIQRVGASSAANHGAANAPGGEPLVPEGQPAAVPPDLAVAPENGVFRGSLQLPSPAEVTQLPLEAMWSPSAGEVKRIQIKAAQPFELKQGQTGEVQTSSVEMAKQLPAQAEQLSLFETATGLPSEAVQSPSLATAKRQSMETAPPPLAEGAAEAASGAPKPLFQPAIAQPAGANPGTNVTESPACLESPATDTAEPSPAKPEWSGKSALEVLSSVGAASSVRAEACGSQGKIGQGSVSAPAATSSEQMEAAAVKPIAKGDSARLTPSSDSADNKRIMFQSAGKGREDGTDAGPVRPGRGVSFQVTRETASQPVSGMAFAPTQKESQLQASAQDSGIRGSDFLLQVAEKLQLIVRSGAGEIRIQLKPADLGRLEINAEAGANGVIARIATESGSVKSYLESNLHLLQQSFQEQGLKLERIDVMIQQEFDARNPAAQQQHSGNQESAGRGVPLSVSSLTDRKGVPADEIQVDPLTLMYLKPNSTFHTTA